MNRRNKTIYSATNPNANNNIDNSINNQDMCVSIDIINDSSVRTS